MERSKLLKTAFLVVFVIGCFSFGVFSQTITGKVDGYVKDAGTGQPLANANVIIEGTDPLLGAPTDEEGYFFILNVPPGTYTISATYIGYREIKMTETVVRPDLTTPLNFNLNEAAVDIGAEVIVTGERQLIQADKTSKVETLKHEDIIEMPVENLSRLLATQSNITILTNTPYQKRGYEARGVDDIRMRGGRNNEVSLMIDGMQVSNPVFGGFGTEINTFAIEQMNIQSGGFDASYGNALSGVINITTREGGNISTGTIEYNTSRPFGIDALATETGTANNNQQVQLSLSGPVKGIRGLSYFASANYSTRASATYLLDQIIWDDFRGDFPTSLQLMELYANHTGQIDLHNRTQAELLYGDLWVTDREAQTVTVPMMVMGYKNRSIMPVDNVKGWIGIGFNNTLALNTKLTYRIGNTMKLNFDLRHSQAYNQPNLRQAYYIYRWPTGPYSWIRPNDRVTTLDDQGLPTLDRYPEYNETVKAWVPSEQLELGRSWNRTGQAGRNVNYTESQTYGFLFSHNISARTFYQVRGQQFGSARKVRIVRDFENPFYANYWKVSPDWDNIKSKWELDYNWADINDPWEGYFRIQNDDNYYAGDQSRNSSSRIDVTSQVTKNHSIRTGVEVMYRDMWREDYQSHGSVSSRPTIYHMFPKEGAFYLTDKIEFNSIIVTLGTRIDYANSGGSMWADPLDPLGQQDPTNLELEYNGWVSAKKKYKFSPRFSVAFPLTDETVISFNFGHFYQNPNYRDLYRGINERETQMVGDNIIGNTSLEHEKSIQYEVGMQQQFGMMYALNANLWLKETTNQVGSVRVPRYSDVGGDNPYDYSVFINNNFGSARGLDLSVIKRYSNYFSGNFSYTFSKSSVLKQTSWDGYWDGNTILTLPKREEQATWEQPHSFRGNLSFNLPPAFGPDMLGFKPLSSFGVTFLYSGTSGWSYNPSSTSTAGIGEVNQGAESRSPFTHNIDARFRKMFQLFDLDAQVSMSLRNLLNSRSTQEPYTNTGLGGVERGYANSTITEVDAFTTNNFLAGRNITFGFRLKW